MRFASIRLNLKNITAAVFCFILCIFVLMITASIRTKPLSVTTVAAEFLCSEESASEAQLKPADNPDYLGDVGGEFVSESDEYDGALSVPAYISLDRLDINTAVCKPLEYARVSSLFGYRLNPVTQKYSFHSGYDLAAPHGASIYAMYSGDVITAGYDNGYGNYIILDHEGGFQTLYAHCSELLCKKGAQIYAGDIIARVGSTGNSTGAHLHVEFRKNGQRYDPEWILGGIY